MTLKKLLSMYAGLEDDKIEIRIGNDVYRTDIKTFDEMVANNARLTRRRVVSINVRNNELHIVAE